MFLVRRADPHPTPAEFGLFPETTPPLGVFLTLDCDTFVVTFFEVGGFDHSVVGREKFMAAEMRCISVPQFKRLARGELSWTDSCPVQGGAGVFCPTTVL